MGRLQKKNNKSDEAKKNAQTVKKDLKQNKVTKSSISNANKDLVKKQAKAEEKKKENKLITKAKEFFKDLEKSFKSLFEKDDDIEYISEYYEVPYNYDETTVKIIAQTPFKLYVYWDIADKKKEELISNYGKNFFNETVPVLIVNNKSTGKSFEVEVNDYTNSWYIDIPDNSTSYTVTLVRKAKNTIYIDPIKSKVLDENNNISNNKISKIEKGSMILLDESNMIVSPNGHILGIPQTVTFRNVITNEERTIPVIPDLLNALRSIYDYVGEFDVERSGSSNFK